MKFECYTETNEEYRKEIDRIHNTDEFLSRDGEVIARIYVTVIARIYVTKENKTIMIEHTVITTLGRKTFEALFGEYDWLCAYVVDDEDDDDDSSPIGMKKVSLDITLEEIKAAMEEYANELFEED